MFEKKTKKDMKVSKYEQVMIFLNVLSINEHISQK